MIYIRITDKHDGEGFLALATSGISVLCLPENTYGVSKDHIELLKRKEIPFKRLKTSEIPKPRPHHEEIRNLLTLKYNDGKKIESEKLIEIRQQLMAVFVGITVRALHQKSKVRTSGLDTVSSGSGSDLV